MKDTGIGMSPEFQKHIFEAFTRERSSTVSGIQGTGLGMAITKSIVDMMGGTIRVSSQVGVGTEFVVDLQFRVSGEPVKQEPIPELQGLRALVADDDADTCMSISDMLDDLRQGGGTAGPVRRPAGGRIPRLHHRLADAGYERHRGGAQNPAHHR